MQNPTDKKPFPWGWVALGCLAAAIGALVLLAVVVVAITFVPMFRTVASNQNPSIQSPPLNPIPANPLPTLPLSPTAVPGTGGGSSIRSLPFKFSPIQDPTTLASQSLMDQMVTALNLNNDSDFMAPKSYKGTITLDPSGGFILGNGWCAIDSATLQQNLANMQFQFSINGTNIDLSKYPTLNFKDSQGDACAMTGLLITPDGSLSQPFQMVLTQKFLKQLDDGITSSPYPAGDVILDFSVQFRTGSNNNSNG